MKKQIIKRYKIWGEFPASKIPQYLFTKDKEDLLKSFSYPTREGIRKEKIKLKYDGWLYR